MPRDHRDLGLFSTGIKNDVDNLFFVLKAICLIVITKRPSNPGLYSSVMAHA